MHRLARLRPPEAAAYWGLTYPHFRALLDRSESVAVGAELFGRPVGLALAEREAEYPRVGRIHSVAVAEDQRRIGLGSSLLARVEDELEAEGYLGASAVYMEGLPVTPTVEHALDRRGYLPPRRRMLICESDFRTITQAPWMERRPLPAEYELFPWVELRPEEREDILARQRAAEWYPETLSPFPEEERIEPVSSLGLRFHGQVVGWCITHRMKPDTIRFFRLFIRRDLQPMGRGAEMVRESIWRHEHTEVDKAYFDVAVHNVAMLRFLERRLAPWLLVKRWIVRRSRAFHPEAQAEVNA
jgi:GNAT superfamily N-acetyltransferase